jgi:hypothetical protein
LVASAGASATTAAVVVLGDAVEGVMEEMRGADEEALDSVCGTLPCCCCDKHTPHAQSIGNGFGMSYSGVQRRKSCES